MAKRSKVLGLPPEFKAWLDNELVKNNFSEYEALSAALKANGFEISKSAIHRYGSDFEARLSAVKLATEQARVIVSSNLDEEDTMGQALTKLAQEKMFDVLVKMQVKPDEQSLSTIVKAVAEIARASTSQKKWAADVREKVIAAAEAVDTITKTAGLSDDTANEIRRKILGIKA